MGVTGGDVAMARYIDATREAAAWNAAQEALVVEIIEAHQREWERVLRDVATTISGELEWRSRPWWARAVAWGVIAAWFLIREVL